MPRPPLPLGSWGEIYVVARSGGWQARARYRDFDGRTRLVSAHGKTRAHAKRRLRDALGARATPSGAAISRDSRLTALAEVYFAEAEGEGSGVSRQSLDQYLDDWGRYIKPAMGDLRLREVTPVSVLTAEWHAMLADLRLEDCYLRMLGAHEIGRGCGFDVNFPDHEGTFICWGSERDQTDGFGNAVSPPVGWWIGDRLRAVLHREQVAS